MSVNIRLLTPGDAEPFMALRRQALADSPGAFGSSPDDDRASSLSFVLTMLEGEGESTVFGAFAPKLIGTLGIYRDERIIVWRVPPPSWIRSRFHPARRPDNSLWLIAFDRPSIRRTYKPCKYVSPCLAP